MSERRLLDSVAIVTGASSGIGHATALALAREGAHVALAARNASALEEVAKAIRRLGRDALSVPTDVTRQEQVEYLVAETLAHWGHVDLLIANAGQYIRRPIAEATVADFEKAMAVNFYGSLYAVLAVLPHMLAQRRGHIVLVSSAEAKKGLPPDAPYAASKYALSGFGDVLRQELHGTGVHATTVFAGRIDTPLIADLKVPWISPKIPAEAVAAAIVRAIHRRQPEVFIPAGARLMVYIPALSPRLADWLACRLHLSGWSARPASGDRDRALPGAPPDPD